MRTLPAAMKANVARLKNALRPYEPWLPSRAPRLSWSHSLRTLRQHGFRPATVFDVGVGFGTFGLYHLFPDALFHLIEPTPEALPHLQRISRRLSCEIHPLALGDHNGEAVLDVRSDIQGSTLLEEVGERDYLRFETVPLRRFDTLFPRFEQPALCKIDVQGAELMALRGMTGVFAKLDAVIVETSTIATVKDGAEVAPVVSFMSHRGFVLADILGLKRRPLDQATAQLDLLFVPEASPLRADRRWAG